MDLDRIDRLIAIHVMGWYETDSDWIDEYGSFRAYIWYPVEPDEILPYPIWQPTRSWDQAGMVVNKMLRQKDVEYLHLLVDENSADAGFEMMEKNGDSMTRWAEADTTPLAICLGALKAKEIKVDCPGEAAE